MSCVCVCVCVCVRVLRVHADLLAGHSLVGGRGVSLDGYGGPLGGYKVYGGFLGPLGGYGGHWADMGTNGDYDVATTSDQWQL